MEVGKIIPEANRPPEALLDALDPEQREVAASLTGPLCVLAGAGTGKTRAITHRIAYAVRTGTYNPSTVLAVTFTAKAAGEMRARLQALGAPGVQARTFHSAALRQLAFFLPKLTKQNLPRLVDHKAPFVAQAAARLGLEIDKVAVRDLAAEIEWAKVNLLTPEQYVEAAQAGNREEHSGHDPVTMSRLLEMYARVQAESQAMDFEDALLGMVGLMLAHPEVAAEIRRRYRHFVVDEYQDVSPLQHKLLDQWLGGREEICVVGDPQQTIYSFAGARSSYLLDFAREHPSAHVVKLVRDYRSTPQVVTLANTLMARAGGAGGVELIAQRPGGREVQFAVYENDEAEARAVANRVATLVADGHAPDEIAILYRTNSQSEPFEAALAERGLPYQLRGSEGFFSRPEIREAMLLLRGAAKASGSGTAREQAVDVVASLGWSPEAPPGRGARREKWESLDALIRLVDDSIAAGAGSLAELVQAIESHMALEHAPDASGVALASLHSAKGLEWDAVFLVGMSEGLMPIGLADSAADIAEERRLLYVGITRARESLFVSYAGARAPGSSAKRAMSRFLDGLWRY